jgi:hypothetical protein
VFESYKNQRNFLLSVSSPEEGFVLSSIAAGGLLQTVSHTKTFSTSAILTPSISSTLPALFNKVDLYQLFDEPSKALFEWLMRFLGKYFCEVRAKEQDITTIGILN